MKAVRYYHRVLMMTFVLPTFIVSSSFINRVAAEFYVGEYHTSVDYSAARNRVKETNPMFHLYKNDGRTNGRTGSYNDNDIDGEAVNDLVATSKTWSRHQPRQVIEGRALRPFNPLTPGGTIYLAFIFLIPLTVGHSHLGRSKSSTASLAKGNALLERLIHKVQQDQQTLYSEMGYVDGNLMLRRAWRDLRDTLAKKLLLLPWRRRFDDDNNKSKSKNNNNNKKSKKKKNKKTKSKSWKSPQRLL